MFTTTLLLHILLTLTGPTPTLAGEIVLYTRSSCESFPFIFAAAESTNCRQADQAKIGLESYGASTSRDIGRSCTYSLYTDKACAHLAGKLTSSGPARKCLPVPKGILSYKIACGAPKAANLTRPHPESDVTLNTYYQVLSTFRGKPSGNVNFEPANDFCGSYITTKPTGEPGPSGLALAASLFAHVPAGVQKFAFGAEVGGTQYHVTLGADKNNKYTAEKAAAAMGQAAFASMMADTVAQLIRRPCDYLFYELANANVLDEEIGTINISYVAP